MLKFSTVFILLPLILLTACGGSTGNEPMTPDMAKSMLKLKGYDFTEANFFRAVRANDIAAVKAFFDAGINPNARNEKGETALTFAIQSAEPKTVKALLEKADVNLQDSFGNSPIHLSLLKNKEDVFNALLEKNADVNVAGRDGKTEGQTVLYLAVIRGREDLVEKLLERGANPNLADKSGAAPLAEACIGAGVKPEIIKMLIDKGANVNHQESNGATPLLYIASNNQISSEARTEIVKMLLAAGADKSLKAKNGITPLNAAKQMKNTDVMEILK